MKKPPKTQLYQYDTKITILLIINILQLFYHIAILILHSHLHNKLVFNRI